MPSTVKPIELTPVQSKTISDQKLIQYISVDKPEMGTSGAQCVYLWPKPKPENRFNTDSVGQPVKNMKRAIKPVLQNVPRKRIKDDISWTCHWCGHIYPSRDELATHILSHYSL